MPSLGTHCRHDAIAVVIPMPFSRSNEEIRWLAFKSMYVTKTLTVLSVLSLFCLYQIFMTLRLGGTEWQGRALTIMYELDCKGSGNGE
jgi:hypothetical protein